MLKLLLCIFASATLAVTMLQLRQQRMELNFQNDKLHRQIERSQAKLWQQQLSIAAYTAPNAIKQTVSTDGLKMVPRSVKVESQVTSTTGAANPDAE